MRYLVSIVAWVSGAFEVKRKSSWILKPGRVIMRFGEPIPASYIAGNPVETVMETTRNRIAALIGGEPPEEGA